MASRSQCLKSMGTRTPPTAKVQSWQMGTKAVKKTTGSASGGGSPSTSGENVGGPRGKKRGWDEGGNDDPTKCRKTGENAPPKPMVACKEPRKKTAGYPPIDRKLPVPLHLLPERDDHAGSPCAGLD